MVSLVQSRGAVLGILAALCASTTLQAQGPPAPRRHGFVVGAAGELWGTEDNPEVVASLKLGWYRPNAINMERYGVDPARIRVIHNALDPLGSGRRRQVRAMCNSPKGRRSGSVREPRGKMVTLPFIGSAPGWRSPP